LLAARPVWSDFAADFRARQPDVLVVREPSWPDGPWAHDVLALGPALVVVTTPEGAERFRPLADLYPVSFVPVRPGFECLRLALLGALTGKRRQAEHRTQLARLQQRLNDRIVIERAKGILVQRLGVTEEDAYKRLRVLSRRQRRQIRDIAQSLLDTQSLLMPDLNGFIDHAEAEARSEPSRASPPRP
jgi:hypothetical protein